MKCRHKWVVLQQSIRGGLIVAETCRCEKCGSTRREVVADDQDKRHG